MIVMNQDYHCIQELTYMSAVSGIVILNRQLCNVDMIIGHSLINLKRNAKLIDVYNRLKKDTKYLFGKFY